MEPVSDVSGVSPNVALVEQALQSIAGGGLNKSQQSKNAVEVRTELTQMETSGAAVPVQTATSARLAGAPGLYPRPAEPRMAALAAIFQGPKPF